MVGRLGPRRQAGRARRRSPPPCPRGARRARRRPRWRSSSRAAPQGPGPGPRTRPAGGNAPMRPGSHRRPQHLGPEQAARVDHAWPRTGGWTPRRRTTSSGTARITAPRRRRARRPPRTPARRPTCSRNRARRPGSRDATAPTGQPARSSAIPSAMPTAPAPTIPTTGRSPGPDVRVRVRVVARVLDVAVPMAARPGADRGRSPPPRAPAASASLSAPALGATPQDLLGLVPGPHRVARLPRGVRSAVRFHQTSVASGPRAHPHRPIPAAEELSTCPRPTHSARARPSAPACPTSTGCRRSHLGLRAGRRPGPRAGHGQDPARERAAPRRRRHRSRGGVAALAAWRPNAGSEAEVPFMPARVLLQDFTGVPAVVDLAAMRDAMADIGGDPARVEPLVPADLVIDHSVQVDRCRPAARSPSTWTASTSATASATRCCAGRRRPSRDLRVVPPGTGIVHQVNLEYLASVVATATTRPAGRRVPGHARRHRLAHHDGQRPGRAGLRRGRHRGRGRPAGPAALPAAAARRRRAPAR